MAKYYTTCGNLEFLTTADDPRSAALWSVHQFLASQIDLDSIAWDDPETIDRQDVMEAMVRLSDSIFISEIGFGRDEVATFDTADVLTEWNQLVIAISRIESRVCEAKI